MYRLFLAIRYLVARPISWISMLGIWITVTSTIVTLAIFSGYLREISAMFRGATSDVVLSPRPFPRAGAARLPTFEQVRMAMQDVPGVVAMSPHLLRPVLLRTGAPKDDPDAVEEIVEKNFAELIGLDPAQDRATTDFARHLANEKHLPVDDPANPFGMDPQKVSPEDRGLPVLLVGSGVRENFGLVKGQRVQLATLPDDDLDGNVEPLTRSFVIGGAVRTGHYTTDQTAMYADLAVARDFARLGGDATEICVRVADGAVLDAVATGIDERLRKAGMIVAVETWRARNAKMLAAIHSQRNVLALLLFFFVQIACFNVFATMTILVGDKTRDIGVLGAVGASPAGILALFVTSGFLMALVSSLVGSLSGILLAGKINAVHEGITWLTGVEIFKPDVYGFEKIPIEVQGWTLPLVVVATVLFAVLSAGLPALRAARLDPVRALRQE